MSLLGRGKVRATLFGAGASVLVLTAAGCASSSDGGHAGGDPNGRIMHALDPVLGAMPAESSDVHTRAAESTYTPKCPDNSSGQSGWSAVTVTASFRTRVQADQLSARVGHTLTELGWRQASTPVWDHQQIQLPPKASWNIQLWQGQPATAALSRVPGRHKAHWILRAYAKPPGYALPGC